MRTKPWAPCWTSGPESGPVNVLSAIPPVFSGSPSGVSGPGRESGQSDETPRTEHRDQSQALTDDDLKQLAELKARDREVRAHEAAHQAVGGQYAGAMSFTYQRGPDGAQYAVGGEVPIDVSPVAGDPQATIEKMRVVRAAAMAPAQPSGQDRAVAAQAMQVMLQAQAELAAGEGSSRDGGRVEGDEPDAGNSRSREVAERYRLVSAINSDGFYTNSVTSLFA
nr:putative metalloprotease CJM1_0395 family protein [Marinobacter daepoensis]